MQIGTSNSGLGPANGTRGGDRRLQERDSLGDPRWITRESHNAHLTAVSQLQDRSAEKDSVRSDPHPVDLRERNPPGWREPPDAHFRLPDTRKRGQVGESVGAARQQAPNSEREENRVGVAEEEHDGQADADEAGEGRAAALTRGLQRALTHPGYLVVHGSRPRTVLGALIAPSITLVMVPVRPI